MFTALDAPPDRLDKHEQNFVEQVRNHGWFGTHVMPDGEGPGFAYTTGLWLRFRFPELIVFSMRQQTAQDTFWTIYQELDAGRRPPIGELTDALFQNVAAVLLPVSLQHYHSHLGWSRWFYGNDEFECLQVVYPDRDGHFPWVAEASTEARAAQPDLTEGSWRGRHEVS
ncbi:DUF4262 domain-containing protein [Bradyrhizobium xenonodulans]|uniref:DUF4262 domain-containing protein n=1 Tax=Bradyrhizobium xenonodulans TaxID=2736875 RepID=A0ABY7MEA1_9BRAD|nr:DUF4262 domain-containing protein [Bradyrhizobium xenonodulans]WBL75873.1 DUF4262 domain-containing protein [Bradyrhizobium xenonodulans]